MTARSVARPRGTLDPARLECWMRRYYFDVDIDIGSSSVEPFSFADLRPLLGLTAEDLDRVVFRDSQTFGGDGVRAAIARRWGRGREEAVVATHGSSEAIYLVMHALVRPCDEIVVPFPCYQQLWAIAASLGARIRHWRLERERGFAPDLDALRRLLTKRTRLLVMNFPHNPTGATLTPAERRYVARLADEHGAYILWDNVFTELTEDGAYERGAELEYARAVCIGSLSKAYGLPGLRVGWAIVDAPTRRRCARLRDYMTLHLSPLTELVAQRAIDGADALLARRRAQNRANLELVADWVRASAGAVEWVPPRGGVSCFPRLTRVADVTAFCRTLARVRRVLLVPGVCFEMNDHVRLGFGGSTREVAAGLQHVTEWMEADWRALADRPLTEVEAASCSPIPQ